MKNVVRLLSRPASARPWPLRAYFVLLFVLGLAVTAGAALYIDRQANRDARDEAFREASVSATVAAGELGDQIALVRQTTAALAANPQIGQILAGPDVCTLTFQGFAKGDESHLDIVRPDGGVACSSREITAEDARTAYRGSTWLAGALSGAQLLAPALDDVSGAQMAIATAPIPGRQGAIVAFVDLTRVADELAARYGGGRRGAFLITADNGRVVLSRSPDPKRWPGTQLTDAQRRTLSSPDRRDLVGVERLYASVPVPGVDWRLYVGERESEVLMAVTRLRERQLQMLGVGLVVFLLGMALVYRRVVAPIRRLGSAVREADALAGTVVPVSGPAEVTELGRDVNALIGSVQSGLLERQRAEASYRLLFEGNPGPMWVYDRESLRFLAVNDAALDAYGYSRDEFLSMTIEDIRAGDEIERLRADIRGTQTGAASGLRHAGIWQHRRKDGTVRDVEITSHDHEFEGRPARVVMALDVTERLRAEEALRRSEARYRTLFQNATDLIATADMEGRLTDVNDAFLRTTGYSRDELIGMPVAELVPPEQRALVTGARERKLGGSGTTLYEHELLARDGRRIQLEVSSRLVLEDGRPVGIEAIARDISERVLLEEQLRQAQRLEAVGRLAGGVAHDFNNVLTVIGGYTEALLAAGDGNSEQDLEQIAAATRRAATLTRQLLAFSRQQVLQPRALLLNDVVEGLTPMLSRLLGEDVELVASLAPDVRPVLADPGQLEQVLVNLAVNARDAMPEGGRLTVQTANVVLDEEYLAHHGDARPGPHVLLSVSDEGTGMDADTLAHAFEPFYTTKDVGSGTGLGLATVYGIVKQSGGTIWVYSEPGEGTTIKIYLPITDATVDAPVDVVAPAPANGSETVLVAEDEESLRTLTARMLTQRGYKVITAETATEALEIARREADRIDLLLTDLVMPEISGRVLAERVGELAPGVRVLFMSGYSDDVAMRSGSLAAGAAFLEKPFTGNELAAKVRETLAAAR